MRPRCKLVSCLGMADRCAAEGGIAIGSGMRLSEGLDDDNAISAFEIIRRTFFATSIHGINSLICNLNVSRPELLPHRRMSQHKALGDRVSIPLTVRCFRFNSSTLISFDNLCIVCAAAVIDPPQSVLDHPDTSSVGL